MNTKIFRMIVLCFMILLIPSISLSASIWKSTVRNLQAPAKGEMCAFITLDGVSEADPIVPGIPWFALNTTQNGYKESFALLMSAFLTGLTLQIATTGKTSCNGYAEVSYIMIYK